VYVRGWETNCIRLRGLPESTTLLEFTGTYQDIPTKRPSPTTMKESQGLVNHLYAESRERELCRASRLDINKSPDAREWAVHKDSM
jgi:hypothetical protein